MQKPELLLFFEMQAVAVGDAYKEEGILFIMM